MNSNPDPKTKKADTAPNDTPSKEEVKCGISCKVYKCPGHCGCCPPGHDPPHICDVNNAHIWY